MSLLLCCFKVLTAEPFQPSKPTGTRGRTVKHGKPANVDLAMASTDQKTRPQSPIMDDTPDETKRKTMPLRSKKNIHPGIVNIGSTRRSTAQVAADKARKENAMKLKKQAEIANLQALALLNVKADERGALRKSKAIRRISDIPEEDDKSADNEEFIPLEDQSYEGEDDAEEDNVADGNVSEDDVNNEVMPKAPTKKNKKQVSYE